MTRKAKTAEEIKHIAEEENVRFTTNVYRHYGNN